MVVSKIALGVSASRVRLYRSKKTATRSVLRAADVAQAAKLGDLQELETHPLLTMLSRPNPMMTGGTARRLTSVYLDVPGEAPWILERSARGEPVQMYPVPPHWLTRTPASGPWTFSGGGATWSVSREDVLWLRDVDPANPFGRGAGVGLSLADELDSDEYASAMTRARFANGASPSRMVGIQGASQPMLDRAKAEWLAKHQGVSRAGQAHFHAGAVSVEKIDTSFVDMDLVALREWQRNIVQQVFGVPPEILGIVENSNRATIESSDYLFAKWVIAPRNDFLRDELQTFLVPQFSDGERLVLQIETAIPEDKAFRLAVHTATPWAFTADEHRALADAPPLPDGGGGVFSVPFTNLFVEDLADTSAPAPAPVRGVRAKALTAADIDRIVEALKPERLKLDDEIRELVDRWSADKLSELGASLSFDMLNPRVLRYLETLTGGKITAINEVTRETIRADLEAGRAAGEGAEDVARRIRGSAGFSRARSLMIARTEVTAAANFASVESWRQTGVVPQKEWLATRDSKVRDSHLALDGEVVALDASFPGGASHPGAWGIAAEDINCRCTVIPVVDEKEYTAEMKDAAWRKFDRSLIPWERSIERTVRDGLEKQRDDLLAALRAQ
jgi:HK97 family phage portal protein